MYVDYVNNLRHWAPDLTVRINVTHAYIFWRNNKYFILKRHCIRGWGKPHADKNGQGGSFRTTAN